MGGKAATLALNQSAIAIGLGFEESLSAGEYVDGLQLYSVANNGGTRLDDDTFTGANGTLLSSHTSDSGRGWTITYGNPTINANHVTATAAGSNAIMTGAGVADVDARLIVNLGADGASRGGSIRFRYADANDFLFLKLRRGSTGVNQIEIWQDQAGTYTKLAGVTLNSGDLAANTEYELRIVAQGSSLTGYLNGVSEVSSSSSFNQSSTGVGIAFEESLATGQYLDLVEIWSMAPLDTTPPTVPAGLSATAVSAGQINLAWTAASDNVGVQGYRIYRGGTYLATVGPVGSTSVSDTGLTAGTAYTYTVSAIDAAGNESAQSSSAGATTYPASDTSAPSVPGSVSATAAAWNVVTVSWAASSDNVGVTRYTIDRGGTKLSVVAGSVTSFTDRSTQASSAYAYTVAASDAAGNASAPSAAANVTTPSSTTTATVTYGYDPASELTSTVNPDGVTARATYDAAGRLAEIANTESSGTLSRFTYALDAAGNRTEQTTSVGTTYYSYDALNRLLASCTGGSCVPPGAQPLACLACTPGAIARPAATTSPNPSDTLTSFTYDPVGNRLTQVTYLGTTSYTYDAADRLASSTGPGAMAYRYDANGNELSAGTTTYGYDLADRMVAATVGATTQSYTWSGDGIRLSAATGTGAAATSFLVDRTLALPSVAAERDGTGALIRRALYGASRIGLLGPSSVPAYEHTDALGSVTDLASGAGSSLAWSEYAPYGALRSAGAVTGAPADPFGFTGEYTDAPTGLLHLRARQYDPTIGRFLSVDSNTLAISYPVVAAYVYGAGNPVRYIDPTGRCLFICAVIGAVVGGVIGAAVYAVTTPVPEWSHTGYASHAAIGAATGAVIGFTGGVAALGIAQGTLSTGGAAVLLGTAGYATGIAQTAAQKVMGEHVTAATLAWNVVGGTAAAVIGGPSTGSVVEDVWGARALTSDAVSFGTGVAGASADSQAGAPGSFLRIGENAK